MSEQGNTVEKDAPFCLTCWDKAGKWVDREGGIRVFHYDRLRARCTCVTSRRR